MKSTILTLLSILLVSLSALAQDRIYKKNQDVIECEIIEVSDDQVKYNIEGSRVVFVLSTNKIEKIVFENGEEMTFTAPIYDPTTYQGSKTTAWKFGLISPLTGATNFAYEKMKKPGKSVEYTVGFIGLGENITGVYQAGGYLKAGLKFTSGPLFHLKGITYNHPLMGFYIKPEISIATYEQEYRSYYYNTGSSTGINTVFSSALILNVGKQRVFADAMVFDWSFGFGYGFDNMTERKIGGNTDNKIAMNHFSHFLGGETPIAITGTIKVGFLTR